MAIFSAKVNNFKIKIMANMLDIIFLNLTACHTGERKEKRGRKIRHRYEKGEEKKIRQEKMIIFKI